MYSVLAYLLYVSSLVDHVHHCTIRIISIWIWVLLRNYSIRQLISMVIQNTLIIWYCNWLPNYQNVGSITGHYWISWVNMMISHHNWIHQECNHNYMNPPLISHNIRVYQWHNNVIIVKLIESSELADRRHRVHWMRWDWISNCMIIHLIIFEFINMNNYEDTLTLNDDSYSRYL